jgi:SAM-dependent methyltransferase
MGTAEVQGALWGARARDWADIQEPAWRPVFEAALRHAGVGAGTLLLDVGCGAGGALALAREMGAEVAGLDAAANLVAIARERLPRARIEVGEMEELPFADATFDVITGINSFQFAGEMAKALSEARRVCRPGGSVFMLAWGPREECELMTVTVSAVLALLPPPPPGAKPPGPMVERGSMLDAMRAAGLEPADSGSFHAELCQPDAESAVRANMAAGVNVRAAQLVGEERVAETIRATLPAVTRPDGSVVWKNRFDWVRATRQAS